MIKVLTVGFCERCVKFIEMLEHNKIKYEEFKEPLNIHKYLQNGEMLPILLDENDNLIDRGKFLIDLSIVRVGD